MFHRALDRGADRLAKEVTQLAIALVERFGDEPIVLASLVRAGVPLGVMLHQTLRDMGKTSWHYGISIIRDRGIDSTALDVIEERHGTSGIVFVDGWTGKGAITGELVRALKDRRAILSSRDWLSWRIPVAAPGLLPVMMTGSFLLASWVRRYQA